MIWKWKHIANKITGKISVVFLLIFFIAVLFPFELQSIILATEATERTILNNALMYPAMESESIFTVNMLVILAILLIIAFFVILGFLLQSNKIVRQKNEQLKRITDNIHEGLIVINPNGIIRFINPVAAKILDYKPDQIVNNDFRRIFDFSRSGTILRNSDCPINKALSNGVPISEKNIIIQTKVGLQVHVDTIVNPLFRNKTDIIGALIIIKDLTDSLFAENSISHWKRRYEFVTTAVDQVVYEYVLTDNSIKWSRSIEKVLGYTTSDLSGGYEQWKEKIHPEDRDVVVRASEESKLKSNDFEAEYRFRKKNGEYIYIKEKAAFMTDETGKAIRMLGLMENITKQKQAEDEILKFKVISDNANYGAAILDFNWDLLYINRYFAALHGYTPAELIGRNISALHNSLQMEHIQNIIGVIKSIDTLTAEETWHCHRDGKAFPMLSNFQRIRDEKNNPLFIALTAIDLTDRKEFIKLIEEASERYKTLVANVPGAVYRRLADSNLTVKFISDEIMDISGYNPDDFLDNKIRTYASIIYFNDRVVVGQETYVALREKHNYNIEYRIINKDGSLRWVMERGRGIYGKKDKILYCDGVIIDITERKKSEQALIESEGRLKTKLEYILSPEIDIGEFNLNDVIDIEKLQQIQDDFSAANEISSIILSKDGVELTKPSCFSEIFGLIWNSPLGRKMCFATSENHEVSNPDIMKPMINKFSPGNMISASVPIIIAGNRLAYWFIGPCRTDYTTMEELRIFAQSINVEHSIFLEAFAGLPNFNENRFSRIAELLMHVAQELSALSYNNIKLAKEITIRKGFENQLRKSEHELRDANDSKDRFLSIIAHDLKSPLAALRSMLGLLNADLSDFTENDIKEIIGEMDNSAKNVFELLEDLLSWSRAQTGKILFNPDNIDISLIINNIITLMKPSAEKKNIQLYGDISQNIVCYADANMISTVLRNLVSNAIKFTYPGGEVAIQVTQFDTFVEINVSDSGIGISEENIEKLFKLDSHLTTLGTSQEKGTGLGLILCKEFVEANDGRIWIESLQGKGSNFKFTLHKSNNNQ